MILKTPPMGWSTWNTFGENINEELLIQTADVLINNGYKDAGYEYIIIDDCWSLKERDKYGNLQADPEKFPHGMKYIADYIHSKGLKFGMYSDCGFWTCARYPGSWGYEYQDAKKFAEWGVDYLKYDFGNRPESADTKVSYLTMSQALRNSGRDIALAACNWGVDQPWKWMRSRGINTYRSTYDITDSPESFIKIFEGQWDKFENSTFDCYNDLDMLTVGMKNVGTVAKGGCTDEEYALHFAIWAFFGTPLIIGADIRNIDDINKATLLNKDLISINQDSENRPPFRITNYFEHGYAFCKLLSNGDFAVFILDMHPEEEHYIPVSFDDCGVPTNRGLGVETIDCVTHEKLGVYRGGFTFKTTYKGFRVFRCKVVDL